MMKIKVKKIHAVAAWKWKTAEDDCAICCQPFDATCGECRIPGDDCPPVWGECGHHFHIHCISRWINEQKPCPMCRREFKPVDKP